MHFFESWFCKSKLNIEVHQKIDFDSYIKKKTSYSIYLVSESEVNPNHEPFSCATHLYGEIKNSILYASSQDERKFFLIAPTLSEPKKLSLDSCGRAHVASHFGAILAQGILTLPISTSLDAEFYVTLSDQMKNFVEAEEYEFLLGILQRSVSHKVKKKSNSEKSVCGMRTVIFRSELFTKQMLDKANALSKSMSVTRTLINMPGNILNPESYENCVNFLVDTHNSSENLTPINIDVINSDQLKNLGCNLILAVGQGSVVAPRIIKLSYLPNGATKHVTLVGKGITFDSGGYNLKPSNSMQLMKKDMGGSAAALGIFFACVQLNIPLKISCYLALAENMISGSALRPGDIYTAYNGLNVEIENTDAEGRLVLADTLGLAVEENPDWIIDLATLTGAARTALGPLIDPFFGNRSVFNNLLNTTSLETGDWIWNLPLPLQYEAYFDSRIADLMNCATTPYAGAITAALFLQKFVGKCAWNHIDTFMWCDKSNGLWGEDNAPTAKCVRLVVRALELFSVSSYLAS